MKLTAKQKIIYALTKAQGIGCVKGRRIVSYADFSDFGSFLVSLRNVSANEYIEIKTGLENTDFDRLENSFADKSIRLVTILDEEYPKSLLPYQDMPLALYCIGDVSLLNTPSFAVVGTRFPTRYGLRATEEFVSSLSDRFTIVSGMARGIDSCAHKSALKAGGKTVAVLGSGVDIVYPPENLSLYRDIINFGLVVSEYEPGTPANSFNFPARNRIISGLSRSVLVTEAGIKSGTMLTINSAIAQGKDVFCVPGSIYSAASSGVNKSIRECQSRAVTDVNDIYDEMGLTKQETVKPSLIQLDFNEDAILNALKQNGEMHVEEILDVVDLSISQLNSLLTRMETAGLINKTKHNYWSV